MILDLDDTELQPERPQQPARPTQQPTVDDGIAALVDWIDGLRATPW